MAYMNKRCKARIIHIFTLYKAEIPNNVTMNKAQVLRLLKVHMLVYDQLSQIVRGQDKHLGFSIAGCFGQLGYVHYVIASHICQKLMDCDSHLSLAHDYLSGNTAMKPVGCVART